MDAGLGMRAFEEIAGTGDQRAAQDGVVHEPRIRLRERLDTLIVDVAAEDMLLEMTRPLLMSH